MWTEYAIYSISTLLALYGYYRLMRCLARAAIKTPIRPREPWTEEQRKARTT